MGDPVAVSLTCGDAAASWRDFLSTMADRELTIGFDADDTLWHNEAIFERVHERYRELLAHYHDAATVDRTLFATEMRNLALYGYGVKGFTLSAIETAVELTQGKISAEEIRQLIVLGQGMLAHPVELLEGVEETLAELAGAYRLIVITKGDLHHQERKLALSGLAARFRHVEIVSEKDAGTYAAIFRRYAVDPREFLMVGNSSKSDIVPVLALGGAGVHVPYHITWAAERVETPPEASADLFTIKTLRELPGVVRTWAAARGR
jgi:putative hydrolase of the HAD superfamily